MLNLRLNQEMQGKDPDPTYWEYRVQPGIIDLNHLELVALKRVSKASWMPHFRLVDPSRSIRCPSPTTYSHAQEHVSPSHREPNVSQVDITEGSGVHERSSALGPANPAERATTEEQSPIPRPVQPAEEAAKGPTPVSLRVGSRVSPLKFQGLIMLCLLELQRTPSSLTPAYVVVGVVLVFPNGSTLDTSRERRYRSTLTESAAIHLWTH